LKNQKADIRILLRSADRYAVAFYAKLQGYNLYCGPGLGFGPKGMFRYSYHESGESHLHVPKTLSENLSMRLEERRTSPRMGLSMYPFSKEMRPLREPNTTKKSVDYFRLPRSLWRKLKKCLPNKRNNTRPGGRPRASDRAVMDAIWYVLWSGCQWKAVHRDWFGVSSSVIHERFQRWTKMGLFEKLMKRVVEYSS
jgi:hypothetical protein